MTQRTRSTSSFSICKLGYQQRECPDPAQSCNRSVFQSWDHQVMSHSQATLGQPLLGKVTLRATCIWHMAHPFRPQASDLTLPWQLLKPRSSLVGSPVHLQNAPARVGGDRGCFKFMWIVRCSQEGYFFWGHPRGQPAGRSWAPWLPPGPKPTPMPLPKSLQFWTFSAWPQPPSSSSQRG